VERLLLARHALAGSNRDGLASCSVPGPGLTPEGVEQAKRLGEALASEPIALGVATSMSRTRETLEYALAGRVVERLFVPELDEIRYGSFDGGLLEDYRMWARSEPPTVRAPGGGDSRADVAARYASGFRKMLERPERVVLLVGHALALRYLLDAARGLVPAPLITPVEHATVYDLTAEEVRAGIDLLEEWSRSPAFRPPPV
jgi:2,3-bisphosphoglycerate-dependent phosphoglycerate mutase